MQGLSARTLRALYNARDLMDASFRHDPVNRDTFMRILQQPAGITHAMRLMNQTSVLGRYLWVFRRIVGQMQHDLFHVYTVDQHILMVLRNVRRFFIPEHAHEYPFCSQLAAGWDKPWVLYVAALFHDIAKGRGGDHSELGCASRCVASAESTASGREDAQLIEFLVARTPDHEPHRAKGRPERPRRDRRLCPACGQRAQPDGAVPADRGRHPRHQPQGLERLEGQAAGRPVPLHAARAGRPRARLQAPTSRRASAKRWCMLALHAEPFEAHKALWDTLDVGYFMRHDAADIAWHTRQLSRHVAKPRRDPCVPRRGASPPVGEGLQVVVYTPDQPDLFARICGYFDQAGFSILDAKIHTANNGYALDTFQVVTAMLPEHYQELITMVETELAQHPGAPGRAAANPAGAACRGA